MFVLDKSNMPISAFAPVAIQSFVYYRLYFG
jgi:hypothetical protein